jgi:hypothetical protein
VSRRETAIEINVAEEKVKEAADELVRGGLNVPVGVEIVQTNFPGGPLVTAEPWTDRAARRTPSRAANSSA